MLQHLLYEDRKRNENPTMIRTGVHLSQFFVWEIGAHILLQALALAVEADYSIDDRIKYGPRSKPAAVCVCHYISHCRASFHECLGQFLACDGSRRCSARARSKHVAFACNATFALAPRYFPVIT